MDDQRLRVLIVDDTVVYRRILSEVVEALGEAVVVGTAPHGRTRHPPTWCYWMWKCPRWTALKP